MAHNQFRVHKAPVPMTVAELPEFARDADIILGERGARVIYYFHSQTLPILALRTYAKSVKADLTPADRKKIKVQVQDYVSLHRGGKP